MYSIPNFIVVFATVWFIVIACVQVFLLPLVEQGSNIKAFKDFSRRNVLMGFLCYK